MKIKSMLIILLTSGIACAGTFPPSTKYDVCFTPNYECSKLIIHEIEKAKRSVYVQAYSFTLESIKYSLVKAKENGLDVMVILDKTQKNDAGKYFIYNHIPTWIDYHARIAHNKVMIIDNETVITGSFNFTQSAQMRNTENVLIIHDANLATKYYANWNSRKKISREL